MSNIYAFEDYGAWVEVAALSGEQARVCVDAWLGHDAFPSTPKPGSIRATLPDAGLPVVIGYGLNEYPLHITSLCERCGEPIDDCDILYPMMDEHGQVLCSDCLTLHQDEHDGYCIICEEAIYGHPPNKKLAILEASGSSYNQDDLGDFAPGYYNIISYPFYASDMINTWFWESAIRKIRDLGPEAPSPDKAGYLSGMVCDECVHRLGLDRQINWRYWSTA